MLGNQSGLIETIVVAILSIVTWLTTPRARKKLKEAILNQPKEHLELMKLKAYILSRAPSILSAAIIFGQFMHETANGTSRIFQENNNLFGMKFPHVRKTNSPRPQHGYAFYQTREDSIDDLFFWFENQNFPLAQIGNVESYVALLKQKSYFEDSEPNYLRGVKTGTAKFYKL